MSSPSNNNSRYVRIPIPLRRELIHSKSKPINFFDLHKRSIAREKRTLRVTDYGLLWISFFRGVIVALVVERLLFH